MTAWQSQAVAIAIAIATKLESGKQNSSVSRLSKKQGKIHSPDKMKSGHKLE